MAGGDHANLHMAESCGWKLFTRHGDFVGYLLREGEVCIHIYMYMHVHRVCTCICWSVYKEEEVREDCQQLVHLYLSALSAGYIARLDDWIRVFTNRSPLGINKMVRSSKFSSFLARERERERCGEWKNVEIGLTFASFIKSFHTYSTYCRRGEPVPSSLILFVIPADDHGWFSPVF